VFFSPGYNSPAISPGPFVFTLHDLHHLCVPENSNALKRAYYRYFIRPACHRAAYVLTVSEYSKGEIVNWAQVPEDKVVNVGNGVGSPFIPSGPSYQPGYPYLLYVGSRLPHKNLPRLLKAFAVSGVQRDIRLVVSGDPDQALMAEARQLGLGETLVFARASSNESLAELYRGAHAFAFVSFYEGFGFPPLEAMACGVPVLSSNACSLPEVVGDAGILVDPYEVDAIAEGIRRIVQATSLRCELKQKGLARAGKYTWDQTARKTQEILEAAIAGTVPDVRC
jgi:glycosyltransferase involved in cell wall biosynthesis